MSRRAVASVVGGRTVEDSLDDSAEDSRAGCLSSSTTCLPFGSCKVPKASSV